MDIKEFLSKSFQKDDRFSELQHEMRMQRTLEERQKNSNERELEKYMEEDRQKMIKEQLEKFRKRQQEETWHGKNILQERNIFRGHKSILATDHKALDNGRGILNDKKLFSLKGVPKRDSSGGGIRLNKGRSGCKPIKNKGKKGGNLFMK